MQMRIRRRIRVNWREFIIRIRAFRGVIVLFTTANLIGTLMLTWRLELKWSRALYETISLMFFASSLDYPQGQPELEALWIAYPLIAAFVLMEGLGSIGKTLRLGDIRSVEWNQAVSRIMEDHIVLVGLGNIGLRVLQHLTDNTDWDVVCVDEPDVTKEDVVQEFLQSHRIPLICGKGEREHVQKQAGVERARAIITLVNNDLLNLKMALIAKKLNPSIFTILRMFDVEFGELVQQRFEIGEVISTTQVAAPRFIDALLHTMSD